MHHDSPAAHAPRARNALALGPLVAALLAFTPAALAQLWTPVFLNRYCTAQVSIQDNSQSPGGGGPLVTDADEANLSNVDPIPSDPVHLDADAQLDAFDATSYASSLHYSLVDADSIVISSTNGALARGPQGSVTTTLAYSTYWLIFDIHEPTSVSIDLTSFIDNPLPQLYDAGWASSYSVLRHFQGQLIEQFNFSGPLSPDPVSTSLLFMLEPGRYELFGGSSAGGGSIGGPLTSAIECGFVVEFTVPGPGAPPLLAFAACAFSRRRR
jgi:hypothetical protein